MLVLLWLFFIGVLRECTSQVPTDVYLTGDTLQSAEAIFNSTHDIIHRSNERIDSLYIIKQDNMKSVAFEIGFVMYTVQEKYRKMVDNYNSSISFGRRLYTFELVLYLQEIQTHYFEIEHLVNMAHEIERKYQIYDSEDDKIRFDPNKRLKGMYSFKLTEPRIDPFLTLTKKKKVNWNMKRYINYTGLFQIPYVHYYSTKGRGKMSFPLDYGWDVEGLP